MNDDATSPADTQGSTPPNRSVSGPDAGLLTFGILGMSVFIVLIAALLWYAGQQKTAAGRQGAIAQSQPAPIQTGQVMLPIVKRGEQPDEIPQTQTVGGEPTTTPGGVITPTLTPPPEASLAATLPSETFTPTQSTTAAPIQTATPTRSIIPVPTATFSGPYEGLTIRNDRLCVDARTNLVYIFGEIVNNSPQAFDIIDWNLHLYDDLGEVALGETYFDMPTPSYIFANSAIPFAVTSQTGTPYINDYDLHLDYIPGLHTPRGDLRIDEYTPVRDNRFIQVSGKWSHTDTANLPEFVSVISVAYDNQGRLINMNYLAINYITVDPRLPPGQHEFNWLYLEDNPCGTGTVTVSILGE
jgi:hypothetical protein